MDSKASENCSVQKGKRKLQSLPLQHLKASSKQAKHQKKHSTQHLQHISDELFNYGETSYIQPRQPSQNDITSDFFNHEEEDSASDNFTKWSFFEHEDAETIGTTIKARVMFELFAGCYFYYFGKSNGVLDHSRIRFSVYESHSVIEFIQDILEQIAKHQTSGHKITKLIPFFDNKDPGRAYEEPWLNQAAKLEFWRHPDMTLKSIRMRLILNQQTGLYSVLINANIPDTVGMQYNNWGGSTITFTYPNMKHLVTYLNRQNQIPRPLDPYEEEEDNSFYEALYGTKQQNTETSTKAAGNSESENTELSFLPDPRLEARFAAPLKTSRKAQKKQIQNEMMNDTLLSANNYRDQEDGEAENQTLGMETT